MNNSAVTPVQAGSPLAERMLDTADQEALDYFGLRRPPGDRPPLWWPYLARLAGETYAELQATQRLQRELQAQLRPLVRLAEARDLQAAAAELSQARGGLLHSLQVRQEEQKVRQEEQRLYKLALAAAQARPVRPGRPGRPVRRAPRPSDILPDEPDFRARLQHLIATRPGAMQASELRKYALGSPKLSTLAHVARRHDVPARWLGFNDPATGAYEGLGARLRQTRLDRAISNRALSQASGVSSGMISTLENGAKAVSGKLIDASAQTIEALAAALQVAPGWLAYGGAP